MKIALEDLKNLALADYHELVAGTIFSWDSFIVNAIKNYNPDFNLEQALAEDREQIKKMIDEMIRKAVILKETKNYTYDLSNAERLRGYIKALAELWKKL